MSNDDFQRRTPAIQRARITNRTSRLPPGSRLLYRIDHYSSQPSVGIAIGAAVVGVLIAGGVLGFPAGWVTGFGAGLTAVTLVMVFTIQHTQAREQAATQRKLDELLRAIPGAEESLMMLEEAPDEILHDVEEGHRDIRGDIRSHASTR